MFALTGLFASLSIAAAATFSDGFSSGINPACWTVYQTTAGLYSVDATQGDVRLAKISTQHNPGGIQSVYAAVNMAALGGNIAGDFSAQINFTNAALGGALDQVEFHTSFADGSIFYDVYDNGYGLNAHVWNGGSANGVTAASSGAGTFVIARTGSTLSGYYNGSLLFSENNGSALTAISLALQNNNGSDDAISVTFDNFSLTAASVPSQLTNTCTWTGLAMFLGGTGVGIWGLTQEKEKVLLTGFGIALAGVLVNRIGSGAPEPGVTETEAARLIDRYNGSLTEHLGLPSRPTTRVGWQLSPFAGAKAIGLAGSHRF